MTKDFPLVDVLTVATGVMMQTGADFQGVMDHLYPGIFTLGCAAMQPRAAEEIQRQHPKLRELIRSDPPVEHDTGWCDRFLSVCRAGFGETLAVEGPHVVTNHDIAEAFAGMATEMRS